MRKIFLSVMAVVLIVLCISADNKLVRKFNVYVNGEVAYSVDASDVDSAKFEMKEITSCNVIAMPNHNEMGRVTGGGMYDEGSRITLTAIPNEGYFFDSWNDGNTDNPRTITVTEDIVLIANFEEEVAVPDIQPTEFIQLKEHRAAYYRHDYYQVGAENFEIDFIDEGLTVYGGATVGTTVGTGCRIKVDVNCISAPNMFPKKGYYAVSNKREAGYAVAGFFTDVSDQYGYPAGTYMLPVGCNVIFVENSAIKETVFAVDGWVYFDGTAENGTMRCAYKLENGQTIGFEYTGAFFIEECNKQKSIAIAPATLELVLGETKRLSLKVTPADAEKPAVVWSSSDESIATVSSNGTVTTLNYGNATITATANVDGKELKAECALSVVNELDALKFDRVALWSLDSDNPYTIEYWSIKYDDEDNVVTDPETGDAVRELKTDNVYMASFMMLSDQLYLDGDGYICGAKDSYALSMPTAFSYDSEQFYCLGDYNIVPDANVWYRERGDTVIGKPWLNNIQYGEMDEHSYSEYIYSALSGENLNPDDYPYFRERDAYFLKFFFEEDPETGDVITSARDAGWLYDEGVIRIEGEDLTSLAVPYYDIHAKFMTNLDFYGLATEPVIDEETGEPAVDEEGNLLYDCSKNELGDPYLAPIIEKHLVYGEPANLAPQKAAAKGNIKDGRRGIKRETLETFVSINRILDAPLRIKVEDMNFMKR